MSLKFGPGLRARAQARSTSTVAGDVVFQNVHLDIRLKTPTAIIVSILDLVIIQEQGWINQAKSP